MCFKYYSKWICLIWNIYCVFCTFTMSEFWKAINDFIKIYFPYLCILVQNVFIYLATEERRPKVILKSFFKFYLSMSIMYHLSSVWKAHPIGIFIYVDLCILKFVQPIIPILKLRYFEKSVLRFTSSPRH